MALFGWCSTRQHENCLVTNGSLTCSCNCENHGVNRKEYVMTAEEKRLHDIATKALAGDVMQKANKVDLRKKEPVAHMTIEEAVAIVERRKAAKGPVATTVEELKKKR